LDWTKNELEAKILESDPEIRSTKSTLSLFPPCNVLTKSRVALLCIRGNNPNFKGWNETAGSGPLGKGDIMMQLGIDKYFYGLTPLSNPDKKITVE
jgi:hypothetical protein